MRNEGKIYETLLNKSASKWSKRQVHLFINLLWQLGYRGQGMLNFMSDLNLRTPHGKEWNTGSLGFHYGQFKRSVREPKALKNLTEMLNNVLIKNGRTVTTMMQTSFDDVIVKAPVGKPLREVNPNVTNKIVEAKVIADEMGQGKTETAFPIRQTDDTELQRIQEIVSSNLSASTKKAALRGILNGTF